MSKTHLGSVGGSYTCCAVAAGVVWSLVTWFSSWRCDMAAAAGLRAKFNERERSQRTRARQRGSKRPRYKRPCVFRCDMVRRPLASINLNQRLFLALPLPSSTPHCAVAAPGSPLDCSLRGCTSPPRYQVRVYRFLQPERQQSSSAQEEHFWCLAQSLRCFAFRQPHTCRLLLSPFALVTVFSPLEPVCLLSCPCCCPS